MNVFDHIQDFISNMTGSAGDALNNLSEHIPTEQLQNGIDSASNITDSASGKIDEIKNNLGL